MNQINQRGAGGGAYFLKTVDAGATREIERWKKAPKEKRREVKRAAKANPTPPEMENVNRKNALNKLRWIINGNFVPGDYWICLTYFTLTCPALDQSLDDYSKFMRELRKLYAKYGITLKYVSVTERRPTHKPHHHIALPQGVPLGEIQAIWPHGHINVKPFDQTGQYNQVAIYIFKHTEIPGYRGKRWNGSKNLTRPEPKEREIQAKHWREEPTAPKGWMIDKTMPIERGVNPITGAEYLRYSLIRLPVDKCRRSGPRVRAGATTIRI